MGRKIMIIAGEKSGDLHGSNLVKAIKEMDKTVMFEGVGGSHLESAGVRLRYRMADVAVLGASEVVKKLGYFYSVLNDLVHSLKTGNFDTLILIDFPDFNLRLAAKVKRLNIPIVYYISPQVWAWRKDRVKRIAELVDKMIVILPFEKNYYRNFPVDVDFVGHPMLDYLKIQEDSPTLKQQFGIKEDSLLIGLLPGSRENEIKRILPVMLKTAELISQAFPRATFFIPAASEPLLEKIKIMSAHTAIKLHVVKGESHRIMKAANFILVASGSATLETAFFLTPMVILYKVSFLTWILARILVKIPFIGLVNIIAGKAVAPEFIQYRAQPEKISKTVIDLLRNEKAYTEKKNELAKVREKLGAPGASKRAARIVLDVIAAKR